MPNNSSKSRETTESLDINRIDQLKALANPLRMQLLDRFATEPKTTKQVAIELGLQPTRLYHHVAKLESAGLITLVRTNRIRGTTEKYFEATSQRYKIDRHAFPDGSAKLVGNLLETGLVENFFGVVQSEVSEYLSQQESSSRGDEDEAVFAGTEFALDDAAVAICRNKISKLLDEIAKLSKATSDSGSDKRKYRLVMGWYPKAAKPE